MNTIIKRRNKKYIQIPNNSKVYYNGSKWNSNNCGIFTIVGKTDRYIVDKRGYKERKYYLCEFEDGTVVEAKTHEIKNGRVRNPNHPSICNRGYLGEGKWEFYINQKATKEYRLFHNILNRCYNPNAKGYKTYGGRGVTLDSKLFDFQEFCEMLTRLDNYDKWIADNNNEWELDKDLYCEKNNINPPVYSEETCTFIKAKDNMAERNKRVSITGKIYKGINPDGEEFIFKNIREFSRKHNLENGNVCKCISGKANTHKKWHFEIIV